MNDVSEKNVSTDVGDLVSQVKKTVSDRVISSVKASISLIFIPTKNFDSVTDVQTVRFNGKEIQVSTLSPFSKLKVAAPELSGKTVQEVPGIFRQCFLPAVGALRNLNAMPILKIGTLKESQADYDAIAKAVASEFNNYFPTVAGMERKFQLSSSGDEGFKKYSIDIFLVYTWDGAVIEDVTDAISKLEKALAKVTDLPVTASVGIHLNEAYMLSASGNSDAKTPEEKTSNSLDSFTFSTTLTENNKVLPTTKKVRQELLGNLRDEISPMVFLSKKIA